MATRKSRREVLPGFAPAGQASLSYADADAQLFRYCNSYQRLPSLLTLAASMERGDWLRLLGGIWESCDNIGSYQPELRAVLKSLTHAERQSMMTEDERAALYDLPLHVPVYRGCYAANVNGLSWSLDEKVAASFPFLNRYRQDCEPLLATGTVPRSIAILKLGRNESEVIAHKVNNVTVRVLADAPPMPMGCAA